MNQIAQIGAQMSDPVIDAECHETSGANGPPSLLTLLQVRENNSEPFNRTS